MLSINRKKEYLKTAIISTDMYLGIFKHIKETGNFTDVMVAEYKHHVTTAINVLEKLNIIEEHIPYISKYNDIMDMLIQVKEIEPIADHILPESFVNFKDFVTEMYDFSPDIGNMDDVVDNLDWHDIIDLYDDEELEYDGDDKDDMNEDIINEKISAQSRMKKRLTFKRFASRRNLARKIKLTRTSSFGVLKKRAVLAARRAVMAKFLKGRDKASLSSAEKDILEQRLKRMRFLQASLAIRMLPKIRSIEQKRIAHRR